MKSAMLYSKVFVVLVALAGAVTAGYLGHQQKSSATGKINHNYCSCVRVCEQLQKRRSEDWAYTIVYWQHTHYKKKKQSSVDTKYHKNVHNMRELHNPHTGDWVYVYDHYIPECIYRLKRLRIATCNYFHSERTSDVLTLHSRISRHMLHASQASQQWTL